MWHFGIWKIVLDLFIDLWSVFWRSNSVSTSARAILLNSRAKQLCITRSFARGNCCTSLGLGQSIWNCWNNIACLEVSSEDRLAYSLPECRQTSPLGQLIKLCGIYKKVYICQLSKIRQTTYSESVWPLDIIGYFQSSILGTFKYITILIKIWILYCWAPSHRAITSNYILYLVQYNWWSLLSLRTYSDVDDYFPASNVIVTLNFVNENYRQNLIKYDSYWSFR